MIVPDDAGPVPCQRVMRPLRGERTNSVAKCPKQDLNLRWSDFKSLVSSAGLFGRHEQRGRRAGLQSALDDISEQVGLFPSFPWRKQWRLKPLFLVELTLASVLRESSKSIAWL